MTLSKSQYIRGLQCHKSLWLYKNRPDLRNVPSFTTQSLFESGYSVGEVAKELFPNGVEIAFDSENFLGMIEKTKELIKTQNVIYEATFRENGIFAMVDILVKNGDVWDMYEVKASTNVKEYHIDDLSVQYFALKDILPLGRAFVLHVNNSYERNGEFEVERFFVFTDLTQIVKQKQDEIIENLQLLQQMLEKDEPNIAIAEHCSSPFECDFKDYCWGEIPKNSIFNLYRMRGAKKFEMFHKDIKTYDDLPSDFSLSPTQNLQISTYKNNFLHVNKEVLREFLKKVKFPINFLDFETFNEAIPRFNKQRPYQQIPFQYSLHVKHENSSLEHFEFLGDQRCDPREELIKSMLKNLTCKGSIIAFNKGFEMARIRDLAYTFAKYKDELLALEGRFLDLLVPFRNLGYYDKNFNGSFSIKSILPAMFPNDKELSYENLENIQNGGDAMEFYASLHLLKDNSQKEQIRKDLLKYCKLDTLAMVKIYEKLALICR